MELYVDGNINILNRNGNIDAPFQSIEEARDYIREKGLKGSVVNIRGGRYFFNHTIRFTSEDRDTVYKAYNGEQVIFDGGIFLDVSKVKKIMSDEMKERIIEKEARDSIYEVDLSEYKLELAPYGVRGFRRMHTPAPNELFINGKPQTISCYPKGNRYLPLNLVIEKGNNLREGDYKIVKPVFGYGIARGDQWVTANDAYISGYLGNVYADDTIRIEEIDSKKRTIRLETCSRYPLEAGGEQRFKILNLLEELSEPGEYYIDRDNKKLFFYPPEKTDINKVQLQLSVLETPMLSFINSRNILVQNIIFENSRATGVYIGEGESVKIDNCIFRNLGMIAVQIGQGTSLIPEEVTTGHGEYLEGYVPVPTHEMIGDWHGYLYLNAAWNGNAGKNHVISNCNMYDLASGGVLLGGGDRKNLIPAENTVYNCHITRINRLEKTYKAAINIWGVGNKVSHCDIHNLAGTAIYLHGNDHVIEYNRIHNVVKEISDGGAIYMGRDCSEVGNIFRYNFIYNIKNPHSYDMYGFTAIYFDDLANYNEVYGNYFYDVVQRGPFFFSTVHWNCGCGTSVANNIFIDCYPGVFTNNMEQVHDKMHTDPLYRRRAATKDVNNFQGVDVTSEIWRERYPYLYESYETNRFSNVKYYHNYVFSGEYQNFVDENPSNLNFKIRKDSYLFGQSGAVNDPIRNCKDDKLYFKNIDFDSIGLIEEERIHRR